MKLLNYREGFAANSSSTHSTYFTDNPDEIKKKFIMSVDLGGNILLLKIKK